MRRLTGPKNKNGQDKLETKAPKLTVLKYLLQRNLVICYNESQCSEIMYRILHVTFMEENKFHVSKCNRNLHWMFVENISSVADIKITQNQSKFSEQPK